MSDDGQGGRMSGQHQRHPRQPQSISRHQNGAHIASPSTTNFGDFNNVNVFPTALQPHDQQQQQQQQIYPTNIHAMGQQRTAYAHPAMNASHQQQQAHPQQQQQFALPNQFYGEYIGPHDGQGTMAANHAQQQQHVRPQQMHPQQHQPQHQEHQQPSMFTNANVAQYAAYGGGGGGGTQINPSGAAAPIDGFDPAWVSAVPSSFTSQQEGSAFVKASNYQQHQQHHQHIPQRLQQQPQQQQQQQQSDFISTHQPGNARGAIYEPSHPLQYASATKVEAVGDEDGEDNDEADADGNTKRKGQKERGASEFVKKLFRMLDDTSYASIVSWGPTGDSFIVRDMNDFTRHVLPRHFRHSNFASFVRQLNKYDFHKVKKPGEQGQPQLLGIDQQWEFQHPAFIQGREDLLENVKRKLPSVKKTGQQRTGDDSPRDGSPTMPGVVEAGERGAEEYAQLKTQVATLTASQDQMTSHINSLTKQYQAVIGEMLTFQKNMVQQDQLMQNLIQYLMNLEADRKIEASSSSSSTHAAPIADQSRPQLENSKGAFVSSSDAEKLVSSFADVAKESFSQMSMLAQRASISGQGSSTPSSHSVATPSGNAAAPTFAVRHDEPLSPRSSNATPAHLSNTQRGPSPSTEKGKERESPSTGKAGHPSLFLHPPHFESDSSSNDLLSAAASAVDNPSLAGFEGAGLRVFTVGTLQPRADADALDPSALQSALSKDPPSGKGTGEASRPFGISVPNLEQLPAKMPRVDGRSASSNVTPGAGAKEEASTPSEGGSNLLRVRRSTYVPGWAVPPKVLVVDDDDVCRKLGSKFLQVFGCAIDVAVDGVTAVNKMNLEKYDLVLMDIVMPNLDGVSATSLIREFDARTPIISMTSNSGPQELLSYMSSGMNDVLPKPFTKEGLLNMLEKHLIHLKTVQKMDEIPKALGLPPLSDEVMQGILSATAASAQTMGTAATVGAPGDGANPMAALMGNGPEFVRASQEAGGQREYTHLRQNGLDGGDEEEEEEGLVNPLAGMGFSDEEYISMLQNLIAAGSVSDASRGENADSVANVMGVSRGEGMAAGTRSKESTPQQHGSMLPPPPLGKVSSSLLSQDVSRKRSNEYGADQSNDAKKSRFTELPA